jgi:hypothetical protein
MAQSEILKKAELYVNNLFRDKLSGKLIYHNFAHTLYVKKDREKI